jgi:hypothetical protein
LSSTRESSNHRALEITESGAKDARSPTSALEKPKHLGTQLMIDDFETGYSSLSYLKNFPVVVTAEGVETAEQAQQLRSDGARPHPRLLLFEAPPRQKLSSLLPTGSLHRTFGPPLHSPSNTEQ